MFELQVRESTDKDWSLIWKSRLQDEPIESLQRLIKFMESLRITQVFKPDTQYRVTFLKFFLLAD